MALVDAPFLRRFMAIATEQHQHPALARPRGDSQMNEGVTLRPNNRLETPTSPYITRNSNQPASARYRGLANTDWRFVLATVAVTVGLRGYLDFLKSIMGIFSPPT